jgi:hypothetical protein
MKVLTQIEVDKWFAAFPYDEDNVHCQNSKLFFVHPEANCIDIEYPPKLERLPFFARYLATIGYDVVDFRGALISFTGWGVGNDLDEAPGYRVVEAFRTAAGQPKSFEAASGQMFRADELNEAIGIILQPMIFWVGRVLLSLLVVCATQFLSSRES